LGREGGPGPGTYDSLERKEGKSMVFFNVGSKDIRSPTKADNNNIGPGSYDAVNLNKSP
jgi:hypothetical protein